MGIIRKTVRLKARKPLLEKMTGVTNAKEALNKSRKKLTMGENAWGRYGKFKDKSETLHKSYKKLPHKGEDTYRKKPHD